MAVLLQAYVVGILGAISQGLNLQPCNSDTIV